MDNDFVECLIAQVEALFRQINTLNSEDKVKVTDFVFEKLNESRSGN